jgi:NADPH-dependent curcumin reductase CurA
MRKIPEGFPSANDFEIITVDIPELDNGQMLLKTRWLTLDPYMRSGFMNEPNNRQGLIIGGTVSEVVESRSDRWKVGDLVVGYYGWQEYSVGSDSDVQWGNPDMPNEKWNESG